MVGVTNYLYGADCAVLCSMEETINENKQDIRPIKPELGIEHGTLARNTWALFPAAAQRETS